MKRSTERPSASDPPGRISDLYSEEFLEASPTRNFVPFLRSPSSDYQEVNLHWRNQEPHSRTQDALSSVHWNRNRAERPSTLPLETNLDLIESYPEFEEMPSHPQIENRQTFSNSSPVHTPEGKENKRWTFGGLFKRKEKVKSPTVSIPVQFESEQRPVRTLPSPDSESSPESEPRQNFLRRLSKKKKKVSGDGSKPVEGFLKVPRHPAHHRRSTPEIQSWETTKCPPNLLKGNGNYSSSGSLSLSIEGGSSLSRGSRAAAKEAVKARAEARRESILIDSSSGDEGEDELENNNLGSHSSLSRANQRQRISPASRPVQSSPIHRVSNSSPNIYGGGGAEASQGKNSASGPKWEARIVYTQETLPEDEPVFLRLPKRISPYRKDPNGNRQYMTESVSEDKVITAGLRLPLQISSSYPNSTEPIYANWRQQQPSRLYPRETFTPPPPQKRDFSPSNQPPQNLSDIYRPASFYLTNDEPDSNHFRFRDKAVRYDPPNHNQRVLANHPSWSSAQNFGKNPQEKVNLHRYDQEPQIRRHLNSPMTMQNYTSAEPDERNREPIVSKLGFPVRRIANQQEVSGASKFWVSEDRQGRSAYSPNFLNSKQGESLSRVGIRSADSSPLPVPKHAKIRSPPPPQANSALQSGMPRSNESISSLSSFSAETPSPNIFSSKNRNVSSKLPASAQRSRRIKSEFKISAPTLTPTGEQKSACERLNVKAYTPSPTPPVNQSTPTPVASLVDNGPIAGSAKTRKSPGKNLEDALNELEDMYKSLRLSDEDLLDRAERRDLPTLHQELRDKDPVPYASPRYFRFASPLGSGSLESVATTSGSGSTDGSRRRTRAPPMRRSGIPDRVNDDMAKRKYDPKESSKVMDPRDVMSQSGSFLAFSPAFSPPVSPCPGEHPPTVSPYSHRRHEPDLIIDDVAVRNIRHANAIRVIDEPQPLFGVPLGPITKAPPSDYLHAKPIEKFRPLFRHVKNPDIVKDDQAFRNLRKDLNQENNLSKNWTPRLFSPLQRNPNGGSDSVFNYNIQPESATPTGGAPKKLRAIRSLSANISHYVNPPNTSSALQQEIGKWNSYTDLVSRGGRSSRSLTPSTSKHFREASWVEQANLDEFGHPETVYRPPSPNSTIKKKFKLLKPKPPPKREVSPDPNAPRRPWTDLILQSYKDDDLEGALPGQSSRNPEVDNTVTSPLSEEDNDVFLDASATTPSTTPPKVDEPRDDFSQIADFSRFHPSAETWLVLLPGQKDRRGSYVDPRSSGFGTNRAEEAKRRSWSEAPKQFESLSDAHEAIAGTPKRIVFNPLPSPRRVRQISLEGFSEKPENPTQSEQELNDLIDALVKDADTCGDEARPATSRDESASHDAPTPSRIKKRPSRMSASMDKETKWQAAIAELESPSPPAAETVKTWKVSSNENPSVLFPGDSSERLERTPSPVGELLESKEFVQESSQLESKAYKKCTSEPPPEPSLKEGTQGYPRGILKKRPTEGLSPILSSKNRTNAGKSQRGITSACMPPWMQHSKTTTNYKPCSTILNSCNLTQVKKVRNISCEPAISGPGQVPKNCASPNPVQITSVSTNISVKDNSRLNEADSAKAASPVGGMSGLRRLLMRENSTRRAESAAPVRAVKKSPSTGTVPSYWSKISSNQPSFLRKIFEKVNPSTATKPAEPETRIEAEVIDAGVEPEVEPILNMTVAQKASHFMKLEHSQRFSKWRNLEQIQNELTKTKSISNTPCGNSEQSLSGSESCAPVAENRDPLLPPPGNFRAAHQLPTGTKWNPTNGETQKGVKPAVLRPDPRNAKQMSLTANGMSNSEPSKLSLKDRVQMFNKLTSVPSLVRVNAVGADMFPSAVNNTVPPSQAPRLPSHFQPTRTFRGSGSSSSLNYYHPAPIQDIDSSYDNLTSFPLFRNHSTNDFPSSFVSTTSASIQHKLPPSAPISVVTKQRIKCISYSADNDLSEDGEVSSGGMEVAEIISKSYENSPLVQKKSWGSSKGQQPNNFSKDLWRKYGGLEDNISQWSTATDLPEVNSFQSNGSHFAKVTVASAPRPKPKTSTSNLLSLITAMSSSDDQLDEPEVLPIRNYKSRSVLTPSLQRFKLTNAT